MDKPILFSRDMVRAILAGDKTQTRRVIKPQPQTRSGADYVDGIWFEEDHYGDHHQIQCPYGAPGSTLWVRETHRAFLLGDAPYIEYAATARDDDPALYPISSEQYFQIESQRWRPSIFMPRWASRIQLKVLDVRAERLQDIREDDAKAEGVVAWHMTIEGTVYRPEFMLLWDKINAQRGFSWNSNPWVWVVEFERVHE